MFHSIIWNGWDTTWTASGSADKSLPSNRLSNKSGPCGPCWGLHRQHYQSITGPGDHTEGEGQWAKVTVTWSHLKKKKSKTLVCLHVNSSHLLLCTYWHTIHPSISPSIHPFIHQVLLFNVRISDYTDIWLSEADNSAALMNPHCFQSTRLPKVIIWGGSCRLECGRNDTPISSDRTLRRGDFRWQGEAERENCFNRKARNGITGVQKRKHFCGRTISLHVRRHSPRTELRGNLRWESWEQSHSLGVWVWTKCGPMMLHAACVWLCDL